VLLGEIALEGAEDLSWHRLRNEWMNEWMNEERKEDLFIFHVAKHSLQPLRPCKPRSLWFRFLNYINISTHTDWHFTILTITLMLLIFLLLILLLLLLFLPILYYCYSSTFIQLLTIITHVGQVGNTWINYVKYNEIKDLWIILR